MIFIIVNQEAPKQQLLLPHIPEILCGMVKVAMQETIVAPKLACPISIETSLEKQMRKLKPGYAMMKLIVMKEFMLLI